MAAQAHLTDRFLDVLGNFEDIHTVLRGKSQLVAFLHYFPFVIRPVAKQAVNVLVICFG
jgi:hypothetical protein